MTSLSIRQYVLGIYKQLGLREKDITKVQTGGPGKCPPAFGVSSPPHHSLCQMEISAQVSTSVC